MKPCEMKMCTPYIVTKSNVVENIDSPKICAGDIIYYIAPNELQIEHFTDEETQYFYVQKYQIEEENNISNFEVEIVNFDDFNTFLYCTDDAAFNHSCFIARAEIKGRGYNCNLNPDNFYGIKSHYKPHEKVYYWNRVSQTWGYGEIEYILFNGAEFKYVIRKENDTLDTFEYAAGQLRRHPDSPDVIIFY